MGESQDPRDREVGVAEIDLRAADAGAIAELHERARTAEREAVAAQRQSTAVAARLQQHELETAEAEHRLKTSLMAIEGWSKTLLDRGESMTPAQREQGIRTIHQRARQSIEQLERLLSAERPTAFTPHVDRVDVCELAAAVVSEYSGVSDRHSVSVDAEGVVHVWTDREMLHDILAHLLDNAIKYSPDGGEVRVAVDVDETSARIAIVDDGVGVPDGVDIMAPFERGPMAHVPGNGLGLSVVRRLMDQLGAELEFDRNRSGVGSTFTVSVARDRRSDVMLVDDLDRCRHGRLAGEHCAVCDAEDL